MPAAVNQELLNELSSSYIYFKEKENIYNSLPVYEAQIHTMLGKCNRTFLKNIWLAFAFFILYCWTCYNPYENLLNIIEESMIFTKIDQWLVYHVERLLESQPVLGRLFVLFYGAMIFLIVCTIFIGFFFIVRHYLIKLVLWERRKIYGPKIAQMAKNIDDGISALLSNYQVFSKNLGFDCPIPFNYSHPEVVRQIADYVMNGRASSVKEALNLMHMDEHYRQMLNIQSQILISAQNTERYAYSAASSARWAAWNTFFR